MPHFADNVVALRPFAEHLREAREPPPYPLAPIQAATCYSGSPSSSMVGSPVETTSSRSCRTNSISDRGTPPSGEDEIHQTSTTALGRSQKESFLGPDEDFDPSAQRESLLPEGKAIRVPGFDYSGPRPSIKQKQNCGRRTKQSSPEAYEPLDEVEKRRWSKQRDHGHAEKVRRNDHKNLMIDQYMMTPTRYLEKAGWRDKNKAPTKQQVFEANVYYQVDLAKRYTKQSNKISDQDKKITRQKKEIQELHSRLEACERRPSIPSWSEAQMTDFRPQSLSKVEPFTQDRGELHSVLEPPVMSGPPTPALSASGRSSPLPRSRPVSRTGSPARPILPPLSNNSNFCFPFDGKRKTQDGSVEKVVVPNDLNAAQTSPKRRRH